LLLSYSQHKYEWAIRETDWLGYWLTPQGLMPWKKKIYAILRWINLATPLCMFIGCVNYNHDMLPSHAHLLKPLMDQSGLTTYFMDRQNTKAFVKMRLLMTARA
jgi:hypothetical protein